MSDHYDRYNGMENLLSTNLAEVGTDAISRQQAIEVVSKWFEKIGLNGDICLDSIRSLPSAEPQIIYCKDCRKHNKKVGFDENFHTVWKEDACPLASWRGKAQGHEFDYQFCACAERKTE